MTEAEGVRVPFPVHFECLKGRMAGFNRLGVRRFQCPLRDACNLRTSGRTDRMTPSRRTIAEKLAETMAKIESQMEDE